MKTDERIIAALRRADIVSPAEPGAYARFRRRQARHTRVRRAGIAMATLLPIAVIAPVALLAVGDRPPVQGGGAAAGSGSVPGVISGLDRLFQGRPGRPLNAVRVVATIPFRGQAFRLVAQRRQAVPAGQPSASPTPAPGQPAEAESCITLVPPAASPLPDRAETSVCFGDSSHDHGRSVAGGYGFATFGTRLAGSAAQPGQAGGTIGGGGPVPKATATVRYQPACQPLAIAPAPAIDLGPEFPTSFYFLTIDAAPSIVRGQDGDRLSLFDQQGRQLAQVAMTPPRRQVCPSASSSASSAGRNPG